MVISLDGRRNLLNRKVCDDKNPPCITAKTSYSPHRAFFFIILRRLISSVAVAVLPPITPLVRAIPYTYIQRSVCGSNGVCLREPILAGKWGMPHTLCVQLLKRRILLPHLPLPPTTSYLAHLDARSVSTSLANRLLITLSPIFFSTTHTFTR